MGFRLPTLRFIRTVYTTHKSSPAPCYVERIDVGLLCVPANQMLCIQRVQPHPSNTHLRVQAQWRHAHRASVVHREQYTLSIYSWRAAEYDHKHGCSIVGHSNNLAPSRYSRELLDDALLLTSPQEEVLPRERLARHICVRKSSKTGAPPILFILRSIVTCAIVVRPRPRERVVETGCAS